MRTLLAAAAALVLVQSIPAGAQPAPPRQERVKASGFADEPPPFGFFNPKGVFFLVKRGGGG